MLFYKTFYINALKIFKKRVFDNFKNRNRCFFLLNALISVFFILSSFNLIVIRFFIYFYLRLVSNPSRYSFSTSFSMLLFSSLSYFPRLSTTILIVIYLRFLNAF